MSRPVANPLALAVLACLWERPMYPYEITTTLRERNKEDSIRLNFGSLYAVIKSLEKHGLIEVERVEREGNRPERVVYAITAAGQREADEWLRELLEHPTKEYPAIETGLSLLPIVPPAEASALLHHRVELLDEEIARRKAEAEAAEISDLPELFIVESTYKLAILSAERTMIADLADRIDAGRLGGHAMWSDMHRMLADGQTMDDVRDRLAAHFTQEDVTPLQEY